jgi:hypothetical protein
MTFAIWKPPTPPYESWVSISDEDRFFKPKCWDLPKIISAIDSGNLTIDLSTTAQNDYLVDVKFNRSNLVSFLKLLENRHHVNSQWCLPPADGNHHDAHPADSYKMGFDRFQAIENVRREPHVYIKFAVIEETNTLMIYSLHHDKKY